VVVNDAKILKGTAKEEFVHALEGSMFTSTERRGKFLGLTFADGVVVLHFGLSGEARVVEEGEGQIVFDFGSSKLVYDCPRRFGNVRIVKSWEAWVEEQGYGPDAASLTLKQLKAQLESRRGKAKTTLMNQKVVAGLGNVYVDEILFQIGRGPEESIKEVPIEELNSTIRRVLDVATRHQGKRSEFPEGWLSRVREEGADCPRCSGTIKVKEVGGRSTYFCSQHQ